MIIFYEHASSYQDESFVSSFTIRSNWGHENQAQEKF